MLKIVEAFSGIGSQAKALEKLYIDHKILCTVDWDINAIIAYDLIHNGKQDLKEYNKFSKTELVEILSNYTLSWDGKVPATKESIAKVDEEFLRVLYCAIKRTNNLISITDVKGKDLPQDIDLLTYSFPCQDLSVAGYWHGTKKGSLGISRDAHNRSGMLWEVERILLERYNANMDLPKMLLMENVSNILSKTNIVNFNDWQNSLEKMGYYNQVFTLNASNFGIPQKRVRTYMLSVYCKTIEQRDEVEKFFFENNLEKNFYPEECAKLEKFIKNNYKLKKYKEEADLCQASDTPSRKDIYRDNVKILETNKNKVRDIIVPTITTKQDRHPNSGVIDYFIGDESKSQYRFLTPRECFLLMGFEEKDYEILVKSNIYKDPKRKLFTYERLYKLAGNSIVVNVLESIFKQVEYIKENILIEDKKVIDLKLLKKKMALLKDYNEEEEEEA